MPYFGVIFRKNSAECVYYNHCKCENLRRRRRRLNSAEEKVGGVLLELFSRGVHFTILVGEEGLL